VQSNQRDVVLLSVAMPGLTAPLNALLTHTVSPAASDPRA
jgi:hypothetical protein